MGAAAALRDTARGVPAGQCGRRAALCGVPAGHGYLQAEGTAGGLLPHDRQARSRLSLAVVSDAAAAERRHGAFRRGVPVRAGNGELSAGLVGPPDGGAAPVAAAAPPAAPSHTGRKRTGGLCRGAASEPQPPAAGDGERPVPHRHGGVQRLQGLWRGAHQDALLRRRNGAGGAQPAVAPVSPAIGGGGRVLRPCG